ncbi:ATP-binding protein [Ruegeria sp. R8_2]|nr:ATP-binding protein [Ruegeria sp. R8_1]MBO9415165.1 ATP-binding protein [Ruegeria sp. R8_2]
MIERRIKVAKFPATKSLDSFDFAAIPSLNKMQVLELARGEWIDRGENVIALGPNGTGKTHVALGLGLAACQKGQAVRFTTAAAIVHELMEARDERQLLRRQKQLVKQKLLITSNLPFDEWTEIFRSERLTGALLDRLTHHVSILEMNGESCRLAQSRARQNS